MLIVDVFSTKIFWRFIHIFNCEVYIVYHGEIDDETSYYCVILYFNFCDHVINGEKYSSSSSST